MLTRTQAAREMIINSPLIPAWEKQLQREALIKQTHHTTSIKGNPLTLEEVGLVIEGKQVLAHEKSEFVPYYFPALCSSLLYKQLSYYAAKTPTVLP